MTIRIGIKNMDSRENAIVAVKCQNLDGTVISPDTQLSGGQECEKYVHSGQKLSVEEVRNG